MNVIANVSKNSQLTRGKNYVVIGLDDTYFRIVNDSGEPTLYPRRAFTVTDDTVPHDWIWQHFDDGEFYAAPPELSSVGFYERYFDHDEEAVTIFNHYIKKVTS